MKKPIYLRGDVREERFVNVVLGARFEYQGCLFQKLNDYTPEGKVMYENKMCIDPIDHPNPEKGAPFPEPDTLVFVLSESIKSPKYYQP